MAKFRAPLKVKAPVEQQKKLKLQESNAKATVFRKTLDGGGASN